MPGRMSKRMLQTQTQNICQKVCQNRKQIECQMQNVKVYARKNVRMNLPYIYTSRWYVRNYVRIWQNTVSEVSGWGSLEESNLSLNSSSLLSLNIYIYILYIHVNMHCIQSSVVHRNRALPNITYMICCCDCKKEKRVCPKMGIRKSIG